MLTGTKDAAEPKSRENIGALIEVPSCTNAFAIWISSFATCAMVIASVW